jgi:hypothetical protein
MAKVVNKSSVNPKYDAYKVLAGDPLDKSKYTAEDHIWLEYWVSRHKAARVAKEKLAKLEEQNQPDVQIAPKQQASNNDQMKAMLAMLDKMGFQVTPK